MGNYCYTADVIKGLFCILEKGQDGQAYNVVNEHNTMTIRAMAEMAARELADGKINIRYDIPESPFVYGYAPPVQMRLSAQKLRDLGWQPEVGLSDMYKRLIWFWGYEI